MSEDSPRPKPPENPIVAIIAENKIVVVLATVVLIAGGVFMFSQSGNDGTPAPTPSISSSATLGDGNGTAPATVSPTMGATAGPVEGPTSPGAATASPKPTATDRIIGDAPQAPERADWNPTAESFAKAWTNPTGGKEAWLERIKPHVTDKLFAGFEQTIMQNVYTDEFIRISIVEEENAYVIFTAEYKKNGTLFQGMAQMQGNGEWRIANVAPPMSHRRQNSR